MNYLSSQYGRGGRRTVVRNEAVDGALAELCARSRPGQCWTLREIATECGITVEGVRVIHNRALRKLRGRLREFVGKKF